MRWYIYDGLGSVLAEVDPSGNVTAGRKYDIYGLVRSGQSGISKHKFVGKLGHVSEDETGLIYMGARYMDPVLGKFVSEDLSEQGANWLIYCKNNPVNQFDSGGNTSNDSTNLCWWIDGTACAIACFVALCSLPRTIKNLGFALFLFAFAMFGYRQAEAGMQLSFSINQFMNIADLVTSCTWISAFIYGARETATLAKSWPIAEIACIGMFTHGSEIIANLLMNDLEGAN